MSGFIPDTGPWTAFTPTIAATVGSITTSSGTGRYKQLGKFVYFTMKLTITTNGTGSSQLQASIPVTALSTANYAVYGRENQVAGKMLQGIISTVLANKVTIWNYDNTYPGVDGAILMVSGFYEAA